MERYIERDEWNKRLYYLEEVLEPLIVEDFDKFLTEVHRRLWLVVSDVYGASSRAARFFDSIYRCGIPHPYGFDVRLLVEQSRLVPPEKLQSFSTSLGFEFLKLHEADFEYYEENSLYGLMECLDNAGVSFEDSGRYFENFQREDNIG